MTPNEIESKYAREFAGYRRLGGLADELWQRNKARPALDTSRPATAAVLGLYAKAKKSFQAIEQLAAAGFGEDAMIIARSLTNLCIDLAYICRTDSDDRARQWIARGRVSRRTLANTFGHDPPDEAKVDWAKVTARANQWEGKKIRGRADDAGLMNFYRIAYQHGSVFEHSDAWGALAFLDIVDDAVEVQTEPSQQHVGTALLAGAFAFAQTVQTTGVFWGFDFGGLDAEMERVAFDAFHLAGATGNREKTTS